MVIILQLTWRESYIVKKTECEAVCRTESEPVQYGPISV